MDYIVSENISLLESGISELKNNIEKMHMIFSLLSNNQSLLSLEQTEGPIPGDQVLSQSL
ncbi:MAG TPA: hypothetical protein VIL05_09550 [Thermoclostridium sp.]